MTMETIQVGNSLNTFVKAPGEQFSVEDKLLTPTSPGLLDEEIDALFEKELGGLNFSWGLSIRTDVQGEIRWVDPRNQFYKGPAVFVYDNYYFAKTDEGIERFEFPIRISDRIMNPTYLDICRFLNPIFAQDGKFTDHTFLAGISPLKLMPGSCYEQSVPVFSFGFE